MPLLVDTGLLQQAESACRRKLANDAENQALLTSLAQICRKQGKLDEAADLYARVHGLDPQDSHAAYMNAVIEDGKTGTKLRSRKVGLTAGDPLQVPIHTNGGFAAVLKPRR